MRAFSRMRFGSSKKDEEATSKVEEKENTLDNGVISPSLIPKFSGARHSPRKRITTFGSSPLTRTMNKVSLEINKIELSNITSSDRQIDSIFCTLKVGSDREVSFTSSLITKRNNNITFSFSINDTVLRDISMSEYSARHALLSIKSTNIDGTLLGEASISLGTNPDDPSSRHKIVVLKDRKRVGDAYYTLLRPIEGFLDDSASEDGDQASATPSPLPNRSPLQMANNASPVTTSLDLTDSPVSVPVRNLLQSPKSPVRTSRISGNARTLLTLQNMTVHNQATSIINNSRVAVTDNVSATLDSEPTQKTIDSAQNQQEENDFSKEQHHIEMDDHPNLPVSPILPQRTSSSENILLSPIAFSSPCQPESSDQAVEEPVHVKQETPIAVLLTSTLVSQNQCQDTPQQAEDTTAISAGSTNPMPLDHSPVLVSLVPSTPLPQQDTAHDPPAASTVVAATPSMTVLGSVNRLHLRQQLRQQQRQQTSECDSTPSSFGTHSPTNIDSNTSSLSNNNVHGSVRRTLAQVKERLQRLQPTPSTVDIDGISLSSSSPSFSETPMSLMEKSGNKRIRRRLSLTSKSSVSPVPVESYHSTPDVGGESTDMPHHGHNLQKDETFSSPAVCLLGDFEDETPMNKPIKEEVAKDVTLLEPDASFEADYQAINDCLEKKLAILSSNTDYFYGEQPTINHKETDRRYSWTRVMLYLLSILTLFAMVTVIINNIYGTNQPSQLMHHSNETNDTDILKPSLPPVKGFVFQFPSTSISSSSSSSSSSSNLPANAEDLSFTLSVQLQVLTPPLSSRTNLNGPFNNNNNNDADDDMSPVCLHWVSSPIQPTPTTVSSLPSSASKTSAVRRSRSLWSRMKTWIHNFAQRVQSRLNHAKKLKSLPQSVSPVSPSSAVSHHHPAEVESVQGIVRMGDCPSVLSDRAEASSWRLRPLPTSVGVTRPFHLQYLGPLPSSTLQQQAWCLSVTPTFTSELRRCDTAAADATQWRFEDNRLSADVYKTVRSDSDNSSGNLNSNSPDRDTENKTEKVKPPAETHSVQLHWQWNAHYRTNALAFHHRTHAAEKEVEIGMRTWLPAVSRSTPRDTGGVAQRIHYQQQRIDSIV